jgi:hypothetical protein
MEELEAHARPHEHLVERREDDVAHAGLHAPEERAAIREEGAQHAAGACPRRCAAARSLSS